MIGGNETEVKNKALGEEYFFSGGTEHIPMTVTAESLEEATKVWEKTKVKTNK